MTFRLVDSRWDAELETAAHASASGLRIVSPFIKLGAAERLVDAGGAGVVEVLTRFDLNGFYAGVSDVAALRLLLAGGARIRGVRHLHAKLYLFGDERAIVTSANLTEAALTRNHEFGFVSDDPVIVAACRRYFGALWKRAGTNLRPSQVDDWERRLEALFVAGAPPLLHPRLADEGADLGIPDAAEATSGWAADAVQAFVKFFGEGHNRAEPSVAVLEEVRRSGCHWACTYPRGKRPRSVRNGALMFMGRLVKRPNDVLIFGRAVGLQHQPGRDDATPEDLAVRSWKETWPHYVRVYHGEFLAGSLQNGVSLNELIAELGSDAFASTQRNAWSGRGNTNPRGALRQQAAVELTRQALEWLNKKFERAMEQHGRIPPDELAELDWPPVLPLR